MTAAGRIAVESVVPVAAEELAGDEALRVADDSAAEDGELEAVEPQGPLRRCIATREVLPKRALLRFVVGPDDTLVPDIEGRLPGRGLWLRAERGIVRRAIDKGLFAKAARRRVTVPDDLTDRVELLLARRCLDLLGLARRAGQAVAGFEKVMSLLAQDGAAVLLGAADAAEDGRRKLRTRAGGAAVLELFTAAELGGAFGREAVVHAALRPERLAGLVAEEAERLGGFRDVNSGAEQRPDSEH